VGQVDKRVSSNGNISTNAESGVSESEWGLRFNFVVKVGIGLSVGLGENAKIGLDLGSMGQRFSTDKTNTNEFLSMGIGSGIVGLSWEGPIIEGAANIKTLKLTGLSLGPTSLNVDRNVGFDSFSLGLNAQAVIGLGFDFEVFKKK